MKIHRQISRNGYIESKGVRRDLVCGRCQKPIAAGDEYLWFQHAFRAKVIRCPQHYPSQSELTTSDKLARLYSIQEGFDTLLKEFHKATNADDVVSALESAEEEAREVAGEYNESADNIEEGFGHETSMSEEIRGKGDSCETWADALSTAKDEVESRWIQAQESEEELPEDPDRDSMLMKIYDEARDDIARLVESVSGELEL